MKKKLIGIFIVFLLFAGILGFLVAKKEQQPTTKDIDINQYIGTILQKPRNITHFSLERTDGKPFDNTTLKNQWTFVFMGFTSCASICPRIMADLARTYRLLEEKKVTPLPKVVMISIDPKRDHLLRLKNYVEAFHKDFYGARGSFAMINQLASEWSLAFDTTQKTKDDYDIQHSGTILLINPEGQIVEFFTMPHKPQDLVLDYQLLLQAKG